MSIDRRVSKVIHTHSLYKTVQRQSLVIYYLFTYLLIYCDLFCVLVLGHGPILSFTPTAAYRALKRGFVYVTPQLRLYSGELAEMADFKISLKHPVRSVMEMCLNLSTQQAVLPVLLTLIIHSKQDQDDGEANHFFQVREVLRSSAY